MRTIWAILQLTRLDSSLLGFFAIFVPLLVRTGDLALSLRRAIPLLFIWICAFVANALDDIAKDQINHPERPLPAGLLTPTFVTSLYFLFLGAALFSTWYYIAQNIAFGYYALITLSISYGYVVEYLPGLKAPYVAAAISIPIVLLAAWYPNETRLYFAAASAFLLAVGREICMDIRDRAGDTISFMHKFRPNPLAAAAFALQTLGLFLLATQTRKIGDIIDLFVLALLLVLSTVYWFKFANYKYAVMVMKIQFVVGLYFLR